MTTLFEIISGNMKADSGTYEWGQTITHAHLPLDNSSFFENKMKLKLFPNPVQSKIELCFENSYPREISIFQANGTEVYNKNFTPMNSIDIDVDFLSSGLYKLGNPVLRN